MIDFVEKTVTKWMIIDSFFFLSVIYKLLRVTFF